MTRVFITGWRFAVLAAGVLMGFGGVFARLYYLHVAEQAELQSYVDTARKMTIPLHARRGDIVDARGNLLATTRPRYHIGLDPKVAQHDDRAKLAYVAALLDMPMADLEAKIARQTRTTADGTERAIRWVKLAEVKPEIYAQIEELGLRGVYGNLAFERYYPGGELAAHVLGYMNKDATPVFGVERYMDYYLRGQNGWKDTEADARRREMAQFRDREVEPRNGYEVELTLDMVVQSVVEEAIQHLAETYDPKGISVIVSDPMTGEILALGNYPSFDPNTFWEFPLASQRNRAVTDLYEPGSTFKIVPVAAALEESLASPNTLIDCDVAFAEHRGRSIKLPSDHHNLGVIPLTTIVAKSSNRGAAQLGLMLGEERLYDYAHRFGFGESTHWGPSGEENGVLHPVAAWDGLTISRLPAGYAVSATPLQVHLAMSSVANGGVLMEPQLFRRVRDAAGNTLVEFSPQERDRVISEHTARTLATMLTAVPTSDGTAKQAAIPGFEVAGKTGTSRKIIDGRYSAWSHFASFSGFFPARAPRVAITVVVDDAQLKGVAYGGIVAAPAFREIGERLADYYALTPVAEQPGAPTYAFLRKD